MSESRVVTWGLGSVGLISIVTLVLIIYVQTRGTSSIPSHCDELCGVQKELKTVRNENIDLRAKVSRLEEELKGTNPPNSRHFYDCKPSKKDGMWTMAIHSYTTSTLSTYYCMSHNGHTSQDRHVPDTEQKKLTCTDQRGTSYPQ